jgi:hypothetical protein
MMLSYSIHLPTFAFNFLACAADILNIFLVTSWVFAEPFEGAKM